MISNTAVLQGEQTIGFERAMLLDQRDAIVALVKGHKQELQVSLERWCNEGRGSVKAMWQIDGGDRAGRESDRGDRPGARVALHFVAPHHGRPASGRVNPNSKSGLVTFGWRGLAVLFVFKGPLPFRQPAARQTSSPGLEGRTRSKTSDDPRVSICPDSCYEMSLALAYRHTVWGTASARRWVATAARRVGEQQALSKRLSPSGTSVVDAGYASALPAA